MMIKYLPYDIKDAESIYEYSKNLIGLTFNDVIRNNDINEVHEKSLAEIYNESTGYKNKGKLGQIIERDYFGYNNNSNSEADFKDAGLELKVTPYKKNKNGSISAKERLVLSMIDYSEVARHEFEASHFWDKCRLLLLIYYQHDHNLKSNLDFRIDFVSLFTPEGEDREIIRKDYFFIRNKINNGKAHELSEADTFYLGAVTKSSDSSNRTSQPFSKELAKPRAFSYKNSYMTQVLRKIAGEKQEDSIVKNKLETDFEQYVINKIDKYKGMSVEDLTLHFNIDVSKKPKNLNSIIAFRMLGIKGNNAEEFEKANVVVKTIRIGNNNKIKEHMSFPTFKFKELVKEDWGDSTFGNSLRETKFLFVVYKFDDNDVLRLMGCQFWNMPYQVIENEVKPVWEKTKKIISEGVKLEKIKNEIHNNLPKQIESKVCHVRPHGRDGKDVCELPDGRFMVKQCFWLNNTYIYSQINDNLKY